MASNRSEIFHFLLFCHFGFLQTSLCSSASHRWHQARFPIFTVCFLAQLSGISWKGALFCVVYCVEFWKYFDLHLSILSLCVSSLARQFCFCFCLFSLWWILRRSGGGMEGSSHFGVLQRRTWFSHALLWIMRTKHL